MSNVKVMVGQAWAEKSSNTASILSIDGDHIEWDDDSSSELNNKFHDIFTFVPANDLEWLAVNCDKWIKDFTVIEKINNDFGFSNESRLDGEYAKQQWHDMRVHLGLEEDMNIDDIAKEDGVSVNQMAGKTNRPINCRGVDIPEIKPVFTQAMCDAGELPPAGSECEFKMHHHGDTQWLYCYVIGETKDGEWIVIHCGNDSLHFANKKNGNIEFKPIKTDEEKLIDELCEVMDDSVNQSASGYAKYLVKRFNITRKDSNNDN